MLYTTITTGPLLGAAVLGPADDLSQRLHAQLLLRPTQFAYTSRPTTCAESFGLGAAPCGNATSNFCYNPALGQSCCAIDKGFCEKGTYCAPVAGYCCSGSEDLAACAKTVGFVVQTGVAPWSKQSSPVHEEEHPEPAESAPTTASRAPSEVISPAAVASAAASSPEASKIAKLSSLFLDGQHRRWVWMCLGIGVVAAYMSSC